MNEELYAIILSNFSKFSNSKEYQKQARLKDFRSISVDRYILTQEQLLKKTEILQELRKQTSLEELQKQLQLQQNIDKKTMTLPIMELAITTAELPFGVHTQRRRMSCAPAVVPIPNLSRRTSVASGIGSTIGVSFNSLGIGLEAGETTTETKRRVRMINRH